jgi:hypothetical protein
MRRWRTLVSAMAEDTDIESGGEETDGDIEFWDESEMTRGVLLFIGLKISEAVLN